MKRVGRTAWLVGGWLALGAAFAGLVLPLVPTTPFLLVAAYAFARSSARFHAWLLAHRLFGPLIQNWQATRSIPRRAKGAAIATMFAVLVLSALLGAGSLVLIIQAVVLAASATFILSRPDAESAGQSSGNGPTSAADRS